MLLRNLLYTGVTRRRRLVVLLVEPKPVATAVRGRQTRKRRSKLKGWLEAKAPECA
jgi:exodeoxyribonuclease V alpha subunit